MNKILLIDNSYPMNSRSTRILNSLKKHYEVNYCAWNRENLDSKNKNCYIYNSNEGYGNKIKKLLGMKKYFKFIKKTINDYKPTLIIAIGWDMLLLTKLSGFKGKIIYEILDMPTSTNKIMINILSQIEKILCKNIDGVTFASRFFGPLYKFSNAKKIILENLPSKELNNLNSIERRNKIRISFMGCIRYFEIMKYLMLAAKDIENIEIYLVGKGPQNKIFEDFIAKNNINNVKMLGAYNYKNIKRFYDNTDLVWAVYPNKDYNVKYAISNKFFECIAFEKPGFFADETKLGKFVEKEKLGLCVNPYDIDDIKNNLISLNPQIINEIKNNIKLYKYNKNIYWEDMEQELFNFIKNIIK